MRAFRTEVIGEVFAFEAIEAPWWDLWRRCPSATPFQSPAWLLAWWRSFSPGRLAAITVWDGERLAGFAPFYLEEEGARLLPVGISLSDYLDVLVDPEGGCEITAALVAAGCSLPWCSWSFEDVAPDASAWALGAPEGAQETVTEQSACPVVVRQDGADLLGSIPARQQRQLRYDHRRAAKLGRVAIRSMTGRPGEFLDHLFRLHAVRWEGRGEAGVLADATVQAFHREALPGMEAAGLARCTVLEIDGEVAGAQYAMVHGQRLYLYIGGFHPRFAEASPGSIMIGHVIEEGAREGLDEVHFLRGREAYKYAWGAQDRFNRLRVWERSQ